MTCFPLWCSFKNKTDFIIKSLYCTSKINQYCIINYTSIKKSKQTNRKRALMVCGTTRLKRKKKRHLEPRTWMEANMRRVDPGHLWGPKFLSERGEVGVIPSLGINDTALTFMECVMRSFSNSLFLNKIHLLPQKQPTNQK